MKTKKYLFLCLILAILSLPLGVRAQGTAFTYQGQLQNNGSPANGNYDLAFTLYATNTTGAPIVGAVTNTAVAVTNGLFTTLVDFGPDAFSGTSNWLQIAVSTNGANSFSTLAPRQQLTPTPYAIYAPNAGSAATATTAASASSVPAANIVGAIAPSQVLGGAVTNNQTGVNLTGSFSGNGAGITNVAMASLNSGGALSFNAKNGVYALGATLSGAGATHVAAADLNGDGFPDLVCGGSSGFTIYTNNGNGGFSLFSTINCGQVNAGIAAVDLNGDGKVDLVGAPSNLSAYFLVFTNNGTGGFSLASSNNTGIVGIYSLAVGDVNGDGKMDVLVGGVASGATVIYTNNGNAGFATAGGFGGISASPYSIVLADVDGNGSQDIIEMQYVGVTAPSKFVVITNNGTGGFPTSTPYLTGTNATSLAAADVNGDGWVDVITANTAANSLGIYTNNHSGVFALASTVPVGNGPVSVIAKDLTGDGKLDLICANSDGTLSILVNNGSGGFTLASSPAVGGSPQSVIATNLNNDGQTELITANSGATALSLLFNVSNSFTGTFTGNGSGLTSLNASQLTAGTVPLAQLPGAVVTNGASGVNISGSFSGNGAGVTNLNGANLLAGSVGTAQLAGGTLAAPASAGGTNIVNATANTSYIVTNASATSLVLPTNANVGDVVQITGEGTGGWSAGVQGNWTQSSAPVTTWNSVASSSDGSHLAAAENGSGIYTSTNFGVNWTSNAAIAVAYLASSSDGSHLAATETGGGFWTSTNFGVNWTQTLAPVTNWYSVASSSDGSHLAAAVGTSGITPGFGIWTSTNSGVNWTQYIPALTWWAVASSSDGSHLAAVPQGVGYGIYTSTNFGVNWTSNAVASTGFSLVASSSDGSHLAVASPGGGIYTSTNFGVNWTSNAVAAKSWQCVASSSDGSHLVAGATSSGGIWTSTNFGVTWMSNAVAGAHWTSVASSSDGSHLAAALLGGGIYISPGVISSGAAGTSASLQYLGNGQWGAVTPATVSQSSLPANVVTNTETGVTLGGTFSGNGGGLTNLNTANLTGTISGAQIADGTISNVDIAASAAIAYSKLNLASSILNADVNSSAAIAYSKLNLAGSIVNVDISASAAIADSKLATISTASKVADSALSANVALLNYTPQNFSGAINTFAGSVGVGTTTPGFPLNFASSVGDKIALYGNSGTHYGLGIQNGLLQIYTDLSGSDVAFGYGQSSALTETMRIKGNGNVGIGTNAPQQKLHVIGNILASGTITGSSDRNVKKDFAPVDPRAVLEKVSALPISTWRYIADEGVRHLGPMAQDFYSAFAVGMDDKHISMVDADGVALAAIQGLNQKLEQKETEIVELRARLEKLERLFPRQAEGGAR